MSSLSFDNVEKQFLASYADLAAKAKSAQGQSEDELQHLAAEIQDGLAKSESLVQSMDLEARTADPSQRAELLARLRQYKIQLLALKKSVRQVVALAGPSRGGATPLGSVLDSHSGMVPGSNSGDSVGPQRDRLLSSTGRLSATGAKIGDARRMALQSEQLGVSILMDLHDQRQSLLYAQDMLDETDDEISRARHILRIMVAKMNRNKWSIGLIFLFLFLAIGLVIYLKLQK